MSEQAAPGAEAVVQPFREAAGAAIAPVETAVAHAELLGIEVSRLGSQCEFDLRVMIEGIRSDSAVARNAELMRRRHREEELALDIRLAQLEDENADAADRARDHAERERPVLARAEGQRRSTQLAAASLNGASSATEALSARAIAAADAAGAATDRLRALIRHQGRP
jgi:hypothetical protein